MENNQDNQHKIEIELPADVAGGQYSNIAIIAHSAAEFIVDFAAILPGVPKAKVRSRIILNPENAKRLMLSLQENIARYEKHFGTIKSNGAKNPMMGGGFA
ncbi:MAG: DUF3467 domain-containing protein [Tidjanibacter sp.]|nr:DUF3467 domain-containing protein [Tidjanibacter sp.]